MNEKQLLRKISQLESINDSLITELRYIDELMRSVGFENGIETLKSTANEVLSMGVENFEETYKNSN